MSTMLTGITWEHRRSFRPSVATPLKRLTPILLYVIGDGCLDEPLIQVWGLAR